MTVKARACRRVLTCRRFKCRSNEVCLIKTSWTHASVSSLEDHAALSYKSLQVSIHVHELHRFAEVNPIISRR